MNAIAKGASGSKGRKGGKEYVKAAMLWKLFLKSKLRSYADKNGCMMLCDQEKPSKYFTAKKIRVDLTHDTSEAVRRPPMGINLAAATI